MIPKLATLTTTFVAFYHREVWWRKCKTLGKSERAQQESTPQPLGPGPLAGGSHREGDRGVFSAERKEGEPSRLCCPEGSWAQTAPSSESAACRGPQPFTGRPPRCVLLRDRAPPITDPHSFLSRGDFPFSGFPTPNRPEGDWTVCVDLH